MSDNNLKVEGSKVPAEEITNPALKEAIEKMQAENSKENVDAMINRVLEAKFILPARVTQIPAARTENGQTMMTNQTQVQFRLLENNRHEKFFGVFTDIEEMYKWNGNEEANKVVTDFDSLAHMIMDPKSQVLGFVINPFGKSVTFPKPMAISIKQQRDYMRLKENTLRNGAQIKLGEPEEYPIDLMAALINHFSTEPGVNAAFLRLIVCRRHAENLRGYRGCGKALPRRRDPALDDAFLDGICEKRSQGNRAILQKRRGIIPKKKNPTLRSRVYFMRL